MSAGRIVVLSLVLVVLSVWSVLAQNTTRHTGDLLIAGGQTLTIDDGTYYQRGNVTIADTGRLVLRNATLYIEQEYHGQYGVVVLNEGRLVANSARIDSNFRLDVSLFGHAEASLTDFTTGWLAVSADAVAECQNVHVLNGLLIHQNPRVRISDSDLRALTVFLTGTTPARIRNLGPGRWASVDFGAMFETGEHPALNFENTRVEEVDLGIPHPGAAFTFFDCEVSVTINVNEPAKLSLDGLASGQYDDFTVANLRLVRCRVVRWLAHPNAMRGELGVSSCSDLGTHFTGGSTHAVVARSTVDLCAISYSGDIEFQDATVQGDMIFDGSRFDISGSVHFSPNAAVVTWHDTQITRAYDVVTRDRQGQPCAGVEIVLTQAGGSLASATTDRDGRAVLEISFSDANRNSSWQLEATFPKGGSVVRILTFFTTSPVSVAAP